MYVRTCMYVHLVVSPPLLSNQICTLVPLCVKIVMVRSKFELETFKSFEDTRFQHISTISINLIRSILYA